MTREELFRAVGEVREDQITEAETMGKGSRPWRRLGVLAACLALLATMASALPWVEEQIRWKALVEGFNPGIQEDLDAGGSGDPDGSDYWTDGETRPASHFSTGVEIGELSGPGDGANMAGMSACLAWLSPEEIFAQNTVIFRGTVRSLRYFRIETGALAGTYYTVANMEVTDSIRGGLEEGETYRLLYPGAKGYMTTSISGGLENLEEGSDAIFMPVRTGEDTGRRDGDAYFCYADLGELYLSEGLRFVFADTEDGLVFDRGVYEEIAGAQTLEEVADYIRGILETETARPAAVPAESQPDPEMVDPSYIPNGPAGARERNE